MWSFLFSQNFPLSGHELLNLVIFSSSSKKQYHFWSIYCSVCGHFYLVNYIAVCGHFFVVKSNLVFRKICGHFFQFWSNKSQFWSKNEWKVTSRWKKNGKIFGHFFQFWSKKSQFWSNQFWSKMKWKVTSRWSKKGRFSGHPAL